MTAGLITGLIGAFCGWGIAIQPVEDMTPITETEIQKWSLTGTWQDRVLSLVWVPVLGVAFTSLIGLVFWLLMTLMSRIGLSEWLLDNLLSPNVSLWPLMPVSWAFFGAVCGALSVPLTGILSWLWSFLLDRYLLGTPVEDTRRVPWTEFKAKLIPRSMNGGVVGGVFGVVWALSNVLKLGSSVWLFIIVLGGLLVGLATWLGSLAYDKRLFSSQNAGTWQSLWIGLAVGLMMGTMLALLGGLAVVMFASTGHGSGLPIWVGNVVWGAGIFFAAVGTLYGGGDFLRHFILRFWLWRAGQLPWNLGAFLDEADRCILVYKAERGYRFIHDLFREYLASIGIPAPASSTP